jgi:hypothetical protein
MRSIVESNARLSDHMGEGPIVKGDHLQEPAV